MDLKLKNDCRGVNWEDVPKILKEVGMAYFESELHKRAFENSHTVVFAFDEGRLIGFGRAISDGAYQAAIYDVAVLPEYQGKGVGAAIVCNIMQKLEGCNFILYASPGKEKFYEKLRFRRMKTGMAAFLKAEQMQTKGFTE